MRNNDNIINGIADYYDLNSEKGKKDLVITILKVLSIT